MTGGWMTWVRRFSWVIVPVLVLAFASWVLSALHIDPGFWPLLPMLIAIFLIGWRVGEWWWVWLPPVVLVILWLAIAVWVLVLDPPWDPLAAGILVVGGGFAAVGGSLLHGLVAAAGVWWRQQRDDDFPFRGGDLPDAPWFRKD